MIMNQYDSVLSRTAGSDAGKSVEGGLDTVADAEQSHPVDGERR
ncbi:hypothetical protein [Halorubrum vacuolatum]|uniref:Uncharacterized protein n=1 Tax=Halorubrum vacuolatum TaxID=63740 RepID=A0A238W426_HALVU|nr:hypothetical protein [Halorubrum vacuolatum]SNR41300.1 hypothetical protein SAMN06264855_105104 [Halorubrum vacuolatum]